MKKEPLSLIAVKTLLAILLFAGIGTIIIGGGWLIGNYNKVSEPIKKDAVINNDKKTRDKVAVEKDIKDETADWKTYRNEKYGFEIKYPENWMTREYSPGRQTHLPEEERTMIISFASSQEGLIGEESVNIFVSPPNSMPWELYIQAEAENVICKEEMPIQNIKDLIKEGEIKQTCFTGESLYFSSFSDRIFHFYAGTEGKQSFNQILSTFKFIEKDETADWKTYRNEKYGFEIKYPENLTIHESDFDSDKDSRLFQFNKDSDSFRSITVKRFKIRKDQTYEEIIVDNSWLPGGGPQREDFSKFKSVKIGNNSYYYRGLCGSIGGPDKQGNTTCDFFYYYWLVNGQSIYEFELFDNLLINDKNMESENTPSHLEFKKILSTFKFTGK